MTKAQAQRECDRLNKKSREVTKHSLANANAVNFWNNCSSAGNSLISGGTEGQRADMLVRMLESCRSRSGDAVVVLTGSDVTEMAVTKAAQEGRLGKAVVSSPRYPNYHPLHQMDPTHICKLLMAVARQKNYGELEKLENYINAFVAIASRYYPPSLAVMAQLDAQCPQNQQLFRLGESARVGAEHLMAISSYPAGTKNLRNLLNLLSSTYQNISSPAGGKKANLLTCVSEKMLICVNVTSLHPQIMDLALAAELEQLMASRHPFTLVLNDVPLRDAEGLYKQVADAKNVYSWTQVGVCTQNAFSWAKSVSQANTPEDTLLKNTQKVVLFHNPDDSDGDLDEILKYLGTYLKHEVAVGGGHGAEPITLFHTGDWRVAAVGMHNRVAPEDLDGYGVLLKGHRGRYIDLYRGISI